MRFLRRIILVGICLAITSMASAGVYAWIDENGVRRFSNQPPIVEAEQPVEINIRREIEHDSQADRLREQKEQKELTALKKTWQKRPPKQRLEKKPDVRIPVDVGAVVMYSTPGCGYCARARQFFQQYNVAYTEKNIRASKSARKKFKQLGGRGVPLIMVGNTRIRGFNVPALKSALGL